MTPSRRQELGSAVAELIKSRGAFVTSVLPLRPGERIVYETRSAALGEELADNLRSRGFGVVSLGMRPRLVPDAVVEFVPLTDWSSGPTRRVAGAGHVQFHTYEAIIPSDAELGRGTIPDKPGTWRPIKPPPQRRRRG